MTEMDYGVDLNLFRILNEIYAQESLTEAGRVLHMSQPAVSHALSRLRSVFDDPLFVRQGNRMVPTALTRSMVPSVRTALRALSSTVRAARTFEAETADIDFRLGFRDILESILFPELCASLTQTAPNLRFSSIRVNLDSVERDLATGKLDLVVDIKQETSKQIHQVSVGQEPLVVVLRKGHPLLESGLTKDSYVAARHVLVALTEQGPEWVDQSFEPLGLQRNIGLRCQHYFAGCRVVAQSDLLTTMPRSYARILVDHLPVVIRPPPLEVPPLDIRMYWHHTTETSPAHQWLRHLIQEALTPHLTEAGPLQASPPSS